MTTCGFWYMYENQLMASSMDAVDLTCDLQFCCPAKFANGIGIKIRF